MATSNFDLFSDVLESLKKCATVPVVVDGNPNSMERRISISRIKLGQMVKSYPVMFELANKCWSNFPEPPCSERTYVFMWAIACSDYSFNHGTISWERSTPNTFVHLWSIVDRMKLRLSNLNWIIGTRNCADYCRSTGMTGPLDASMYARENTTPHEILKIDSDFVPLTFKDEVGEFCSYDDFCSSVMTKGVGTAAENTIINASDEQEMIKWWARSSA